MVSIDLDHIWVSARIDSVKLLFDLSFKPHNTKSGLDLAAITG